MLLKLLVAQYATVATAHRAKSLQGQLGSSRQEIVYQEASVAAPRLASSNQKLTKEPNCADLTCRFARGGAGIRYLPPITPARDTSVADGRQHSSDEIH